MTRDDAELSPASKKALHRLEETVERATKDILLASLEVIARHNRLPEKVAIAQMLAYLAGHFHASAELLAFKAGGTCEEVEDLCGGTFIEARRHAFADAAAKARGACQ